MKNSLEEQIKSDSGNISSYLNTLPSRNPEVSVSLLHFTWQAWDKLSKQFLPLRKRLDLPIAQAVSQKNFVYTWFKNEHYLECEIFDSGTIELFYLNRKTDERLSSTTTIDLWEFSPEILSKLEIFADRYLVIINSDRLGYEKAESQEVKPII